jgi:hypothetical protein
VKASELIVESWYLSGIVSRDLETVGGSEIKDGLRLLQDLLDETSINGILIPYYTHAETTTVQGQEEYDIDGLIDLRELTFNIDNVRYSMRRDTQKRYFGDNRVDDVTSLPFHYFAERKLNGMRIYLYFIPDQAYTLKITGKYEFMPITFDSILDEQMDRYYVSYLRYSLAKRMCDWRGYPYDPQKDKTLSMLEYKVTEVSGVDLSTVRTTRFGKASAFRYGQANLGRGWVP